MSRLSLIRLHGGVVDTAPLVNAMLVKLMIPKLTSFGS